MAVKLFLVLSFVIVAVSGGILETLLSWDINEAEARSVPQSKCICQTSGCLCCIDLNLTSLDGPACVNIKQKENNVSLNLNYGDNPVHNATIKIADAANKPTCMNLAWLDFSSILTIPNLSQLCAKFTTIKNQDKSGYDGCLVLEPTMLQTVQATYPMGCFNFNHSVKQIPPIEEVTQATTESGQNDEEEDAEEWIAAVSEGAKNGLVIITQLLGLNTNSKINNSTNNTPNFDTSNSTRSGRLFKSNDEKNDERFKQLLSNQDNIVRESARIIDGGQTKFVYTQNPEILVDHSSTSEKVNLPNSVPRESRRGGRAYNIQQHVNDV